MASSTFTRYECDWCRAEVEITHSTFPVAAVDRPREWARAQLEDEGYDLCAYCAEALRALKASRGAPVPARAMEGEFVAS
jgi:hypothetical protein